MTLLLALPSFSAAGAVSGFGFDATVASILSLTFFAVVEPLISALSDSTVGSSLLLHFPILVDSTAAPFDSTVGSAGASFPAVVKLWVFNWDWNSRKPCVAFSKFF